MSWPTSEQARKNRRLVLLTQLHESPYGLPGPRLILWCRNCPHVTTAGAPFCASGNMRCWQFDKGSGQTTCGGVLKTATNPVYTAAYKFGGKEAVIELFQADVPID